MNADFSKSLRGVKSSSQLKLAYGVAVKPLKCTRETRRFMKVVSSTQPGVIKVYKIS